MIENDRYLMIFEGLGNTVKITLGALVIGVIIGLIIAVTKYLAEDSKVLKPMAKLCQRLGKVLPKPSQRGAIVLSRLFMPISYFPPTK